MLGKAFKKEPKCYNLGDISEGVRRGNCPLLPSLGSAPGTNDHRFKCKQQRGSHIRERERVPLLLPTATWLMKLSFSQIILLLLSFFILDVRVILLFITLLDILDILASFLYRWRMFLHTSIM